MGWSCDGDEVNHKLDNSKISMKSRVRVVPYFSLSPPRLASLACGDFHARSRFVRSTILEEKWGLLVVYHF